MKNVLVDTSQEAEPLLADIRRSLVEFFRAMNNRHETTLIAFGRRPTTLVDYTRDSRQLEAGIPLVSVQTGSGAYLTEAMIEASRGLRRRERSRCALVVLTSGGQEFSNRDSMEALAEVQQSGCVLIGFVVPGTSRAFDSGPRQQGLPVALPDRTAHEGTAALAEAARVTGGRYENLVTPMLLPAKLRELAGELNNQYRVIYEGPRALFPRISIEVESTRPDLRVRPWIPLK